MLASWPRSRARSRSRPARSTSPAIAARNRPLSTAQAGSPRTGQGIPEARADNSAPDRHGIFRHPRRPDPRGRRADHGDQQTGDSAAAPGSSAGTSSKLSPETQPSGPDWLHEPSTMGASYRGFTSSASIRRRRSWRAFTFASAGAMTFSAILVSNVSNPSYRCGGSTQSYFQ